MYQQIPWLNRIAFLSQTLISGRQPEQARKVRMAFLRYMNLAWIIIMRQISDQVANRFRKNYMPQKVSQSSDENFESTIHEQTTESEEENVLQIFNNINNDKEIKSTFRKLITNAEIEVFRKIEHREYREHKCSYDPEYWIVMRWAVRLIQKAYIHGYLPDAKAMSTLIDEVDRLRDELHILHTYSNITISLVYVQVVTIAVYTYFLCHLFGAQFVELIHNEPRLDLYIPIFTIIQFMFYLGWLKVAMCVLNPFGDDEEDFQTSDILNENLQITYTAGMCGSVKCPKTVKPYTIYYKTQSGCDTDNFEKFMTELEEDLQDVQPDPAHDDTFLEFKLKSTWKSKIRDLFSRRPVRSHNKAQTLSLSQSHTSNGYSNNFRNSESNHYAERAV